MRALGCNVQMSVMCRQRGRKAVARTDDGLSDALGQCQAEPPLTVCWGKRAPRAHRSSETRVTTHDQCPRPSEVAGSPPCPPFELGCGVSGSRTPELAVGAPAAAALLSASSSSNCCTSLRPTLTMGYLFAGGRQRRRTGPPERRKMQQWVSLLLLRLQYLATLERPRTRESYELASSPARPPPTSSIWPRRWVSVSR